jgi:uncharacterized membrane protein
MYLENTWLAFLGYAWTPYLLSALALAELVTDQLPKTPSRKVPMQFGARIVTGGLCGTALGVSGGTWIAGLVAGVIGAIAGTLGGSESGQGWWRGAAAGTFQSHCLRTRLRLGAGF